MPPSQPYGVSADTLAVSVHSLGARATEPTHATLALLDASPRETPPQGPISGPTVLQDGIPFQDETNTGAYQYYTITYSLPIAGIEVTLAAISGDPGERRSGLQVCIGA